MKTDFLLPSSKPIMSYRKKNSESIALANLLLELEWEFCSLLAHAVNTNGVLIVSTQTIHDYHREALLLTMRNRPHLSMAMGRLACELARDVFRMSEDDANVDLWLKRSDESKRDRRKVFRFCESDSGEKGLKNLYDMFSNFGIHGHLPLPSPIAEVFEQNRQNLVKVNTSPEQCSDVFRLILMAVHLYTYVALAKFKRVIDRENDELQNAYASLSSSYAAQTEPFDKFVRMHKPSA